MTAEVAILNRNAVALAADSAVTLRLPSGTKIYQTNKLFALSKYEPVAVMVYGSADFMGVPWETIVKRYRAHLGPRSFGRVHEYGADFLNFVERNTTFFPEQRQEQYLYEWVRYWIRILKRRLADKLEEKFNNGNPVTERTVRTVFRQVFDDEVKHLRKHSRLARFRGASRSLLLRCYSRRITLAIKHELQKLFTIAQQRN
jgi:hypothetical protein